MPSLFSLIQLVDKQKEKANESPKTCPIGDFIL